MNHSLVLDEKEFTDQHSHIITKMSDAEIGDQLTFTKQGTREQKVYYITRVVTERINKPFSLLLLSGTRPVIDDIPLTVGGGHGNESQSGEQG